MVDELEKTWYCGSRGFNNDPYIRRITAFYYMMSDEIRTGAAIGIDTLVENYVKKLIRKKIRNFNDYIPTLMPSLVPDWKIGRHAGLERNKKGVDWGTQVVAIWDGESRGTGHCFSYAIDEGIPVHLHIYSDEEWSYRLK